MEGPPRCEKSSHERSVTMTIDLKKYIYHHGKDTVLDAEYDNSVAYGKVKLGKDVIFWKAGLRWFYMPLSKVQRIFRRVEEVNAKICCGRASFHMEKLVLVSDGEELELYIGENMGDRARELLQTLQEAHPELAYGKV